MQLTGSELLKFVDLEFCSLNCTTYCASATTVSGDHDTTTEDSVTDDSAILDFQSPLAASLYEHRF